MKPDDAKYLASFAFSPQVIRVKPNDARYLTSFDFSDILKNNDTKYVACFH